MVYLGIFLILFYLKCSQNILKPIFHKKGNPFLLGPRIGLDPQPDNSTLCIPRFWYQSVMSISSTFNQSYTAMMEQSFKETQHPRNIFCLEKTTCNYQTHFRHALGIYDSIMTQIYSPLSSLVFHAGNSSSDSI